MAFIYLFLSTTPYNSPSVYARLETQQGHGTLSWDMVEIDDGRLDWQNTDCWIDLHGFVCF